jgi:SAM-dependent methyltransferase
MTRPLFAGLSDEDWFRLNAAAPAVGSGRGSVSGLPLVPRDAEQLRFTAMTGTANLSQAFSFYGFCRGLVLESGPLQSDDRVLDFGCGWGRVARFWLRDVAPESLWCVDVLTDAVELLRETRMPANVVHCSPLPPIAGLPSGFRMIHAYSVFSHLSEDAAHRWVAYLGGLLRPGGLLIVTTRGRAFIESLRAIREDLPDDPYRRLLAERAPRQAELERRYAAGEFVYFAVGHAGSELADDFYGEALIPPGYARRFESYGLTLRSFREDLPEVDQPAIVLQRG